MKQEKQEKQETLIKVQKFSVGHLRLLRKMGLKISEGESEAAIKELFDSMTEQEVENEGTAFLWLMTRTKEEILPGGPAYEAIMNGGDWRRLIAIWEFDLDLDALGAALRATRAAAGSPAARSRAVSRRPRK